MTLEMYLDLNSPPCHSVYIFAKKNNIPFDFKKISLTDGEQFGEEFGKISLIRKVPAIRDGDFCLAEGIAIMMYLAKKFHTPDHWYPADLQKRARVNEYLSWQHSTIQRYGMMTQYLRLMIPNILGIEVPKEKMDTAVENLEESLNLFEQKFLQDRPFIAGNQISLADLVAVVGIMQPLGSGLDVFEKRPKLRVWKDRVREAIGAELFDEAHKSILSVRDRMKTLDPKKLEYLKPRILKHFLH